MSRGHGLCHDECIDLRGCSRVVWHRPLLFLTCLTERFRAKVWKNCTKNVILSVCSLAYKPRMFPVGFCGSSFWLCRYFFISVIFIYIYILFSTVFNGNLQINNSLVNSTEYCSNLTVRLNKICILPTVSYLVYQLNKICFYYQGLVTGSLSQ